MCLVSHNSLVYLVLYNLESNRAPNFKSASRFALLRFWNYSRDFSLNCTLLGLITISKFSAPTIAFLAFWLAKKLRLWANSRSFASWKIVCQVFSFRTLCKIVEIKIAGKTQFENLLKQLFHSPLLDMKWLFYHFISNSGSWNNCYLVSRFSENGIFFYQCYWLVFICYYVSQNSQIYRISKQAGLAIFFSLYNLPRTCLIGLLGH